MVSIAIHEQAFRKETYEQRGYKGCNLRESLNERSHSRGNRDKERKSFTVAVKEEFRPHEKDRDPERYSEIKGKEVII